MSLIDSCFMCSNDNKCSIVDKNIVTQVEYVMPEITIIKRGITLCICSVCQLSLQSFSKFKDVSMENNLRLEARLNKAQNSSNNMAQSCKAMDFELLIDCAKDKNTEPTSRDHKFEDTSHKTKECSVSNVLDTNSVTNNRKFVDNVFIEIMKKELATIDENTGNMEDISIMEEPCAKSSYTPEFYNYLAQNTVKDEDIIDNNINYSEDNQISVEKNIPPAINIQQFQIFLPPEKRMEETHDSVGIIDGSIILDTSDQKTSEKGSEKFEEIYIKQENPEEMFTESHDYENENTTTEEFIIDNTANTPQINHEKEEFQCTICFQIFNRKCALVSHVRAHNRPKYNKCNICFKYIEEKIYASHIASYCEVVTSDLNLQMECLERKDFPCPSCDKVFKIKSRLKKHMIIHSGIKDFKCSVCNKLFNRKSNLTTHLRVHNKYAY